MGKVIEGLLNGESSLIVLIFGFLLTYFIWDIIKRIQKVDDVDNNLKEMCSVINSIKTSIDNQQIVMINIKNDVDELKVFSRELSHRVVRLEAIQQLKEMNENGML